VRVDDGEVPEHERWVLCYEGLWVKPISRRPRVPFEGSIVESLGVSFDCMEFSFPLFNPRRGSPKFPPRKAAFGLGRRWCWERLGVARMTATPLALAARVSQ
jgi:hypothetical protein